MSWLERGPFTVFDVETTGMSPVYERIVEIAALRIDKDGSEKRFSTLVNPGKRIPYAASRVHHITDAMVCTAPSFHTVGEAFLEFIEGSTLVAHNAAFDLRFLQESLARCGLPLWDGDTLDTLKLARGVYPGLRSYKLQDLRITLDLECAGGVAHRAGSDVEWTAVLLRKALNRLYESANRG
jgi:DNA polymerase III epsilon subunit family exonuclease